MRVRIIRIDIVITIISNSDLITKGFYFNSLKLIILETNKLIGK